MATSFPKRTVSTVIPAYNVAAWLPAAIESAVRQSYPMFEVIVVDDGSTDATRRVAVEYASRFAGLVRVLSQEHRGASAARNRGLNEALGEFIQFLDADDWLHREKCQSQLDYMIRQEGIDVVFSDYTEVTPDDHGIQQLTVIKTQYPVESEKLIKALISSVSCPLTPTLLMRREAVLASEVRWDEFLEAGQEWDFEMQMAVCGIQFAYCPGALAYIRRGRPGSIWSSMDQERLAELTESYVRKWLSLMRSWPEFHEAFASALFNVARRYFHAGRRRKALSLLREVQRFDPQFRPSEANQWFNHVAQLFGVHVALYLADFKRRISNLF